MPPRRSASSKKSKKDRKSDQKAKNNRNRKAGRSAPDAVTPASSSTSTDVAQVSSKSSAPDGATPAGSSVSTDVAIISTVPSVPCPSDVPQPSYLPSSFFSPHHPAFSLYPFPFPLLPFFSLLSRSSLLPSFPITSFTFSLSLHFPSLLFFPSLSFQ